MISVDSRLFAAPPALPVVRSQPTPPRCAESQGASRCESPVRFRATLARLTQREEKQSTFGRGMRRNCLSNAMRKKKDRNQAKNLLFGDFTDPSFPNCGGSFVWKGSRHITSEHKSHEDTTILSVCRDAAVSQVSGTVWGTPWI